MHSLEKKEYIIVIMSRALPSWHGLCHFSFVVLKINVLWPWSFTYASGIYQGRDRATRDGRTFDCRRSWVAFFWTWHWNLSRYKFRTVGCLESVSVTDSGSDSYSCDRSDPESTWQTDRQIFGFWRRRLRLLYSGFWSTVDPRSYFVDPSRPKWTEFWFSGRVPSTKVSSYLDILWFPYRKSVISREKEIR